MRIPVQVKVSPIVREWMVSYYGSHIIKPYYEDAYGRLIKLLLELPPKDYVFQKLPEQECVTFLMPCGKVDDNRNYNLYRNYLPPKHHQLLNRQFYQDFKQLFHYYMVGYLRAGYRNQKAAIEDFCNCFNLPMEHITYDMLKKSWDRSEEKKHLKMT